MRFSPTSILAAALGSPLMLLAAPRSAAMATSEPDYLFAIKYSDDGCTDAVMLQNYLSNTTYQVMGSTGMDSCPENLMCAMDPEGHADTCPIPTASGENETTKMHDVFFVVNETDGNIYSGDTSNYFVAGPDVCKEEAWYLGCGSWHFQLLDNLKSNPEIMANDNPDDLEKIDNFLYLMYYEDDTCTDLASVIPAASGQELTFSTVSDPDLSCRVRAICGVDPTSDACVRIRDGSSTAEAVQFRSESRVDEATGEVGVYTCVSGNEAADEDECNVRKPQDCIKSSVFSNCSFRYLSGPTLAQNPRYLVGDFESQQDSSGTLPEASKAFTSIGTLILSSLCIFVASWS